MLVDDGLGSFDGIDVLKILGQKTAFGASPGGIRNAFGAVEVAAPSGISGRYLGDEVGARSLNLGDVGV